MDILILNNAHHTQSYTLQNNQVKANENTIFVLTYSPANNYHQHKQTIIENCHLNVLSLQSEV